MRGLQTSFELFLPKGFVDDDGYVHRDVTMRLATARDELEPLRDPRVRDAEDPFLTLVVLGRVLARIGPFEDITADDVCSLFAADLAYLQDCYSAVNFGTTAEIAEIVADADARRAEAIAEAEAEAADLAAEADAADIGGADAADADSDDENGAGQGDGLDDTIDADLLAAALQARFGDDLERADADGSGETEAGEAFDLDAGDADADADADDEDEDEVAPVVTVPSRRRHIEEVGVRSA